MKVEFGKPNYNIYQSKDLEVKSDKKDVKQKKDTYEISEKARELNETLSPQNESKLSEIKKKIEQKFYDSDNVLDVVISRMLKELK